MGPASTCPRASRPSTRPAGPTTSSSTSGSPRSSPWAGTIAWRCWARSSTYSTGRTPPPTGATWPRATSASPPSTRATSSGESSSSPSSAFVSSSSNRVWGVLGGTPQILVSGVLGQELPGLDQLAAIAIALGPSALGDELGEVQGGPLEVVHLRGGAGRPVDGREAVRGRRQRRFVLS